MKAYIPLLALAAVMAVGCDDNDTTGPDNTTALSFFVSSSTSATGNLGGLSGADSRCQGLAAAVGAGSKTWHAYLSTGSVNARDRIGSGPWRNANGAVLANNLNELHSRTGDATLFVDERGTRINGQWSGSPSPNQHDVLTGSTADGRVMAGMTCSDWTSSSASEAAQVGHSDGLGPNMGTTGSLPSWNSAHASESCADTAPRGGAGRIYCFAVN
jgi:Protein of unknown function (DUF1554)